MIRKAMIVAAAQNGVIGVNNKLPWHLPEDLKYFRAMTMGKPIIMGRATYESIGSPLPGRRNIVVSRDPQTKFDGVTCVSSLEEAFKIAQAQAELDGVDEVMVIGGAAIYNAVVDQVERIYFTEVKADVFGDARFELPDLSGWRQVSRLDYTRCDNNPYDYSFSVYDRK